MARAARRTAGGSDINNGAFDKGSEDDKATESAARHGYTSATSNDDEALAPAIRRVRAASAARGMAKGGYIVDGTSDEGSDNDKAKESAARHADVASATALSSVAKAAMPRATDKANAAPRHGTWHGRAVSARKSAGRQAKAQAAHHNHDTNNNDYHVNAAGGRKSKARRRVARKRRFSPQDVNTYDGGDDEGRKTEAGKGTPKVAYTKAASGAAMQA